MVLALLAELRPDAIAHTAAQPSFLFLFIGKGPQHQRVRQLVYDWGLSNCRFLPYQDLEVLPFRSPVPIWP